MLNSTREHIDKEKFDNYKSRVKKLSSRGVTSAVGTSVEGIFFQIDKKSQGRPPEDSGIEIIEGRTRFDSTPQCIVDQYWNWFYNYKWAKRLAEVLWLILPNIHQLITAINVNPENFRDNAWNRDSHHWMFDKNPTASCFWALWHNGRSSKPFVYFPRDESIVEYYDELAEESTGMQVRLIHPSR